MDESSSMDGSLQPSSVHSEAEPSDIGHSGLSSGFDDHHDIKELLSEMRRSKSLDSKEDNIAEKIAKFVDEKGYSLPSLDYGRLLIMAPDPEGLEDWMENLMGILLEVFGRLDDQREVVASVNHSTKRKDETQEALYTQIEKLQGKIHDLQLKEQDYLRRLQLCEESTTNTSKDGRKLELEYKRKLKNMEGVIQEHERRYRVKEQEFEKLKKKLAVAAEKEAESMQRTKEILHVLNTRDLSLIDQSFTELGIGASPAKRPSSSSSAAAAANNQSLNTSHLSQKSSATSSSATNKRAGVGGSGSTTTTAATRLTKEERIENLTYALKAMESDRRELLSRNLELELQVKSLVHDINELQDAQDRSANVSRSRFDDSLEADAAATAPTRAAATATAASASSSSSSPSKRGTTAAASSSSSSSSPHLRRGAPHATAAVSSTVSLREQELLDQFDDERRQFQQLIERLRHRVEELQHKQEIQQALQQQQDHKLQVLRQQIDESHQVIENHRLELDARPTMKQWTTAQREIHDLERKVHDLIMMRGEAAEIDSWRKHLSTSERIRIDKRNHELGLWMLDSLPKQVMKETLQQICRELDLSELSEIPTALQKMKAVVRAVPRMERFIGKVTAFVYDRTVLLNDRLGLTTPEVAVHESFEKTLANLQRWWMLVQKCLDLEEFRESVLFELFRANEMLHGEAAANDSHRYGDSTSAEAAKVTYQQQMYTSEAALQKKLRGFWEDHGRQDWLLRDPSVLLTQIRDMADLQTEVLQSRAAIRAAETFMQERPDLLIHRVMAHIQYLLEVKHLDGILPTINRLYVFSEEMKNFLAALRSTMGKEKNTPVAVLTDEVLSLLTRMKIAKNQVAMSKTAGAGGVSFAL